MRNSDEIFNDIRELKRKTESLEKEISRKELEVQDLRAKNAQMLAQYVGQQRKPMSLNTQIERIRSAEIEVEQLKSAGKILEGQLRTLEDEAHVTGISEALQREYRPVADTYLEKICEIRGKMKEAVKLTDEVTSLFKELMGLPDPLATAHRILAKLQSRKQYEALGCLWDEEVDRYHFLDDAMRDEKKIRNLPGILKQFSDILLANEVGGPDMQSRLKMVSEQIPPEKVRKGPVTAVGSGPRMIRQPDEPADIELHPEKYDSRDVKRHSVAVANRR